MSETNTTPVVETTPVSPTLPVATPVSPKNRKEKRQAKQAAKKAAAKKATPAGKVAPAKAAKKTPAKKAPAEKTPAERFMADIPAPERKKMLVEKMRSKGATKAPSALTIIELADLMGWTKFDVYGLLRGTSGKADSNPNCLIAKGFVQVANVEGKDLAFYLTSSGVKTKFNEAPFVRTSKEAVAAQAGKKAAAAKKSAKKAPSKKSPGAVAAVSQADAG